MGSWALQSAGRLIYHDDGMLASIHVRLTLFPVLSPARLVYSSVVMLISHEFALLRERESNNGGGKKRERVCVCIRVCMRERERKEREGEYGISMPGMSRSPLQRDWAFRLTC